MPHATTPTTIKIRMILPQCQKGEILPTQPIPRPSRVPIRPHRIANSWLMLPVALGERSGAAEAFETVSDSDKPASSVRHFPTFSGRRSRGSEIRNVGDRSKMRSRNSLPNLPTDCRPVFEGTLGVAVHPVLGRRVELLNHHKLFESSALTSTHSLSCSCFSNEKARKGFAVICLFWCCCCCWCWGTF